MSEEFVFQDGQKVVFVGDSITDCGRRAEHAPFGAGYVRQAIDLVTARYPERKITFANEGIGGNTVEDLRNRWLDDVIRHAPDWITVKIGINDLHRTLRGNPEAVPPERFEPLFRSILEDARQHTGARLALIDPFYISSDTGGQSFRSRVLELLPRYLEVVARMAEEFDALHVRTHEEFQRQIRFRPPDTFCPEPVHPNASGHLVIAHALLRKLGW
jgi:lysophospholipase L1-like esterase